MLYKRCVIGIICLSAVVCSQELTINPANVTDPRAFFTNSSLIGLNVGARVSVGYERFFYHLPGDGLDNGLIGISCPLAYDMSLGFNAQYFNSSVFRRGLYRLALVKTFAAQKYGISLDVGLLTIAYDQSQFQLDDLNDPVFADGTSKLSPDAGVSGFARLFQKLVLGIAVKHITRPSLSLTNDGAKLPVSFNGGVLYHERIASPFISYSMTDQEQEWEVGVQTEFLGNLLFQGFYASNRYGLFTVLNIPVQSQQLKIGYQLSIPTSDVGLISDNSHQFMLTCEFQRQKPDFEFFVFPPSRTVYPGEKAEYIISFDPVGSFDELIHVTVKGDFAELTPNVFPNPAWVDQEVGMTLLTADTTRPFEYPVWITAESNVKHQKKVLCIVKPRPRLYAEVSASCDSLVLTETVTITQRNPLLPFVFFDRSSANLDREKYHLIDKGKHPQDPLYDVNRQTVHEQYRNILNIIASRLLEHPEYRIVVYGFNSGADSETLELSKHRARAVYNYFANNCSVPEKQLEMDYGMLPDNPSTLHDPRGMEENRRVEIRKVNPDHDILAPVRVSWTDIKPDESCQFRITNLTAKAGLSGWNLAIVDSKQDTFRVFQGDRMKPVIEWDCNGSDGQHVNPNSQYCYTLSLIDSIDQCFSTPPDTIHTINKVVDKQDIDITRLILFEFDRKIPDDVSQSLQIQLDNVYSILEQNPDATLDIRGHTDIIGEYDYNQRLSMARAETVADYFIGKGIPKQRISYQGFGADRPLLPNDTPEGRMLNRRVELVISEIQSVNEN